MKRFLSLRPAHMAAAVFSIVALCSPARASENVWLDGLNLESMSSGWGVPQANRSVTGAPLMIDGKTFAHGVGTHANSIYRLDLKRGSARFVATVGVDDDAQGRGTVGFQVIGDGKILFDSGKLAAHTARQIDIDVAHVKKLILKVNDGGDGIGFDHADWADAYFVVTGQKPAPQPRIVEAPYLLTPPPGPKPRINGPLVYGARPGHPFLYRIPAQGVRPMEFSAENLPGSLILDATTGIITGTTPDRGEYAIVFHARNNAGTSQRNFTIVSGDKLSLTPSMGWNDWYAHYGRITDEKMRQAADILVSSGMADVGYQYVNIDDCWMNASNRDDPLQCGPFRDQAGNLLPNHHFPDMAALAAYIHDKGLKAGLYTSPGPTTCAGFAGAWQHEAQDAKQFADWGFDFLKYDWCSYGRLVGRTPNLDDLKRPYILMGGILHDQPRDILFNMCQYGMGDVWDWGEQVGAQSWRTSGDLGMELDRIFDVALKNCEHARHEHPGAWNDPDYIQIGYIGNAHRGGLPAPCPLTPTEQYSFMSLWCLMASPLFYSGDLTKLDDFSLNVLCNPEVFAVDQDPLGECARVVKIDDERFIMIKRLAGGGYALGLANRGEETQPVTARWADLGLTGKLAVRDLWRQKDLGRFSHKFTAHPKPHGIELLRVQ